MVTELGPAMVATSREDSPCIPSPSEICFARLHLVRLSGYRQNETPRIDDGH